MDITLLLADSAQVADGKLYILGGGWSVTGPDPVPSAIAIKLQLSGAELDRVHHWELFLEDSDGRLVTWETPDGPQELVVRGDVMASTNPDAPKGVPVDVPLAVNFGPIQLNGGERYVWRFQVEGERLPGASAAFSVRSRRAAPGA